MPRFVLCVSVVVLVEAVLAQDMFEDKTHVMTARCRAQCLSKFLDDSTESTCFDRADCSMCWGTCDLIYGNFKVWGSMCSRSHPCVSGCREACSFYESHSDIIEATRTDTHFTQPLKITISPDEDFIRLDWSRPEGNDQVDPLVYVLMAKQDSSGVPSWRHLDQTVYHNVTIDGSLLKSSPSRIRLTAYDSNGKIAQMESAWPTSDVNSAENPNDLLFQDEPGRPEERLRQPQGEDLSVHYFDAYHNWMPALKSLRYSTRNVGAVEAIISWPVLTGNPNMKFEVEWRHSDDSIDVTGHVYTSENTATLTLWPRSAYRVTLRAFSASSQRPILHSEPLYIDTAALDIGSHPLLYRCPGCVPIEYLVGLAVGVACIAFIIAVALIFIKLCNQARKNGDVEAGRTVFPSGLHRPEIAPPKRTSVKKQLSSISALLTQATGTVSGRHDRLIEEGASLPQEKSAAFGICNV